MKLFGLLLICITLVNSMPTKESTTRRYNFFNGHNTNNETLKNIQNTNTNNTNTYINKFFSSKLFSSHNQNLEILKLLNNINYAQLKRRVSRKIHTISKSQQNLTAKINEVLVYTVLANGTIVSKNPSSDASLIRDFLKNNYEDINSSNKTLKIIVLNKTADDQTNKRVNVIHLSNNLIKAIANRIQSNIAAGNKRIKSTTNTPILLNRIQNKNWPNTNLKNKNNHSRYRNYTSLPTASHKKSTVHKVISKWSDKPPYGELKQGWLEQGIPVPNPNPQISTYSPQYSISSPISEVLDDTEIVEASSFPNLPLGNPLNQIVLDIAGNAQNYANGVNPDCPTVHLTSSVFGPLAKQECSDLSIAVNTHLNQNAFTDRVPELTQNDPLEVAGADTTSNALQPSQIAAPEALDTLGVPLEESIAADSLPGVANPASAGTGGTGGGLNSGGLPQGGLPQAPEFPGLPEFPDASGIFDLFRFLGPGFRLFRFLFRFIRPLLSIIPMLAFGLGFISVLPFYPWWLPFLFATKRKDPEVIHYKHVHKPVHHYGGWFWNHNTKTWTNIANYLHSNSKIQNNSPDAINKLSNNVTKRISQFHRKYGDESQYFQSWKRRKK